jgi:hypothetical protein
MSLIYTLADPRTGEIRYVGKTDRPTSVRLSQHVNDAKRVGTHRSNWVRSLLNAGIRPVLEAVEEVPKSEWEFWEQHWIQQFKGWGFDLVNTHKGGTGGTIAHSEETKRRIGARAKGRPAPHKWKPFHVYDPKTGAYLRTFPSGTHAAKYVQAERSAGPNPRPTINKAIREERNAYGFAWSRRKVSILDRLGYVNGITAAQHAAGVKNAAAMRAKRGPLSPELKAKLCAARDAHFAAKRAARMAAA